MIKTVRIAGAISWSFLALAIVFNVYEPTHFWVASTYIMAALYAIVGAFMD